MRVLVVGSGGREHALVWKLAQSPSVEKLYICPGNPGTKGLAEAVDIALTDLKRLADFAAEKQVDLTVVGPEVPLVNGIADIFAERGLAVFGPSAAAAELEGSKVFAKRLMAKYDIPTAFFEVFTDAETAKAFVKEKGAPLVIKADGLAAGKGVVVAMTETEALAAIDAMMVEAVFGQAGAKLVIEEFMEGEEASLLAFTDGKRIIPMVGAQDHKRIGDGDTGPNTGGMGTYAPAPVLTDILRDKAVRTILEPLVAAMAAEGRIYKGCIYAGLMIKDDNIKVVEFNARFGDPETQVVIPLLADDLAEIMLAAARGDLSGCAPRWRKQTAVCVVLASGGYPGQYSLGLPITGLAEAAALPEVMVFHAGTKETEDGRILTAGGRVLGVTALGATIAEARDKAYAAAEKISFADKYMRHDIALKALRR